MKWPRFQFSLRTLFLVTALIAVGLVSVRLWIGPHRLVIPSESDLNNIYRYEFVPTGNIELEYYNGLGNRKYVSVAYDLEGIFDISSNNFQNQASMPSIEPVEYNFYYLGDNVIRPDREHIIRVVSEINESDYTSRNQINMSPRQYPVYRTVYLSKKGSIYIQSRRHIDMLGLVLKKISLNDVPPSIRSRVSEELDAIRRKQSAAN
jgi:hypothetical protein